MEPGTVIAERFVVEDLLGTGGMGDVYRAFDRHQGEHVAVKLVRGDRHAARFAREAQVLARLRHPGVVRYIAHGALPSGDSYLVMELLVGEDLAARLRRGALGIEESVVLAKRVAEALAVAHARGVVHRDVKPSNIFLTDGEIERAKVLDFGVARASGGNALPTAAHALVGTPGYMAPEQARGDRDLDARADVFALGCVLFECLTGRPAFRGDHPMALLAKILLEDAPRVHESRLDVPASLDELVARMLSKDRAQRPLDGEDVAKRLDDLDGDITARFRTSFFPPQLTRGEQRLLCLLLAKGAPREPGSSEQGSDASVRATQPITSDPMVDLERMHAIAEKHHGRLERFVDGTIAVVLQATPSALDQASQAARCALALHAVDPHQPIALATGRAIIGGRWPVGEVIDRATRLLVASSEGDSEESGRVRVDDVTTGLLGSRFDVRGDRFGLYLAGDSSSGDARTLLGKPTSCVGRDRELALFSSLLDECREEKVARAVVIIAPPGLGKSRLANEFVSRLRGADDPPEIWIARADPSAAGSSFAIAAQAVRYAAGIEGSEPEATRRKKLAARVERSFRGEDAARVTRFLAEIAGCPMDDPDAVDLRAARADPFLLGDQVKRAWADFIAAECRADPVVLLVDDLQWGDLPSVSMIDNALKDSSDGSLLVLAFARPEVEDTFPSVWGERGPQIVHLGGLTKKAAERIVTTALGERATPELLGKIIERASGNAFFLEELVRAIADGEEALPKTVLAVVEARLAGLDAETRRVLRGASVFGQTFWAGGLVDLLGGAGRADDVLPELCAREIVAKRGSSRFPGEDEYAFRHAIVRDTAYAMLTDADRSLGHRLAGAWLEQSGETDALVLAEHYAAGRATDKALLWYPRAAEQALGANDFQGVLARVDRAVAAGASGELLGRVNLLAAEARTWRGEHPEARRLALGAMTLLPRGSGLWCAAAGEAAIACGRLSDAAELARVGKELAAIPSVAEGAGARIVARARASMQIYFGGDYALAEELIEAAERDRELAGDDPIATARLAQALAFRAHFSGDAGAYLEELERAAASFERAGDRRNACVQHGNLGHARITVGDHAGACATLEEARSAAERMGLEHIASVAKHNLGLALGLDAAERSLGSARFELSIATERDARARFEAQGEQRLVAAADVYLAIIHRAAGDLPSAEAAARAALVGAGASRPLEAFANGVLARVLLDQGRVDEAKEPASAAVAILNELGSLDEGELEVRAVHAELLELTGRVDEARIQAEDALRKLLARADKIKDPARRASFLERVPEHARVLALARRLEGA